MKTFYLLACVAGLVLPYAALLSWLLDEGLDPGGFVRAIVEHRIGLFAWLDVLVSSVVLLQFSAVESERLGMRGWTAVLAATCLVGVSLGLPLFLWLRERHLDAEQPALPATH